jgi:hypothetical protein
MCDHAEEQEMESEAMMAIFDTAFEVLQEQPYKWSVSIYPETGDPVELDALNHVACKLLATLPVDYPESVPELQVEIIKGLAPDHQETLTQLAVEEALANEGAACIFAVVERLREWLAENNVTGLDDISMHAQMMRKQKDAVKADVRTCTLLSCVFVVPAPVGGVLYLSIDQSIAAGSRERRWLRCAASCHEFVFVFVCTRDYRRKFDSTTQMFEP